MKSAKQTFVSIIFTLLVLTGCCPDSGQNSGLQSEIGGKPSLLSTDPSSFTAKLLERRSKRHMSAMTHSTKIEQDQFLELQRSRRLKSGKNAPNDFSDASTAKKNGTVISFYDAFAGSQRFSYVVYTFLSEDSLNAGKIVTDNNASGYTTELWRYQSGHWCNVLPHLPVQISTTVEKKITINLDGSVSFELYTGSQDGVLGYVGFNDYRPLKCDRNYISPIDTASFYKPLHDKNGGIYISPGPILGLKTVDVTAIDDLNKIQDFEPQLIGEKVLVGWTGYSCQSGVDMKTSTGCLNESTIEGDVWEGKVDVSSRSDNTVTLQKINDGSKGLLYKMTKTWPLNVAVSDISIQKYRGHYFHAYNLVLNPLHFLSSVVVLSVENQPDLNASSWDEKRSVYQIRSGQNSIWDGLGEVTKFTRAPIRQSFLIEHRPLQSTNHLFVSYRFNPFQFSYLSQQGSQPSYLTPNLAICSTKNDISENSSDDCVAYQDDHQIARSPAPGNYFPVQFFENQNQNLALSMNAGYNPVIISAASAAHYYGNADLVKIDVDPSVQVAGSWANRYLTIRPVKYPSNLYTQNYDSLGLLMGIYNVDSPIVPPSFSPGLIGPLTYDFTGQNMVDANSGMHMGANLSSMGAYISRYDNPDRADLYIYGVSKDTTASINSNFNSSGGGVFVCFTSVPKNQATFILSDIKCGTLKVRTGAGEPGYGSAIVTAKQLVGPKGGNQNITPRKIIRSIGPKKELYLTVITENNGIYSTNITSATAEDLKSSDQWTPISNGRSVTCSETLKKITYQDYQWTRPSENAQHLTDIMFALNDLDLPGTFLELAFLYAFNFQERQDYYSTNPPFDPYFEVQKNCKAN
jgi:hypothetical protein